MILSIIYILFILIKINFGQGADLLPISLSHVLTIIGLDIVIYKLNKAERRKK